MCNKAKMIMLLTVFLCQVMPLSFAHSFLIKPKEMVWNYNEGFVIDRNTIILTDSKYDYELKLFINNLKHIIDYNNKVINEIAVSSIAKHKIKRNIIIGKADSPVIQGILKSENITILGDEGYAIIIKENYFLVAFNSAKGFYYSLNTIEEILKSSVLKIKGSNISCEIPSVRIVDYPSLDKRILHITVFDILDVDKIKKIIDTAAQYRFNAIIFSINNGMKYDKQPKISKPNALSKEQISKLILYAQERHIEVIPEVNLLGHQEWLLSPAYPELILKEGILRHSPGMFHTYNPKKTEVYEIVFDILNEVIEVFKPKHLHIGHDEAIGMRVFDEPDSYQLFAQHVNIIQAFLSKKGIRAMMWGDMLKREHNGKQKGIYKAIDLISKDIIITDWIYGYQNDYPSVRYFSDKGFLVFGAVFKRENAIQSFSNYIKSFDQKTKGMITTTWYYPPWNKIEMLNRLIKVSGENYW